MYIIVCLLLGSIVFMFSYIASKKSGKYYLAPIITFLFAVATVAYGLFVVGGFEGMGYGMIGVLFLLVSIVGTLMLPHLVRSKNSRKFEKRDKVTLIILPIVFFTIIVVSIYSEQVYWIVEQGEVTYTEDGRKSELENYYQVSTFLEGKKQVALTLGKEYVGKEIEVEKVSRRGPTVITLKIVDGEVKDKVPYITIGLDEINEPLTVQTTNGVVFESVMDHLAK